MRSSSIALMAIACATTWLVAGPDRVWGEVPTEPVTAGETGAKVDELLGRLAGFGYSGAVILAKDGKVILSKGYGLANRDQNIPVTPQTVFTIGSITKQFTAAAILKLEMQGKLAVEDPISKYLDSVPKDKASITIHQLLTHTAGLPDSLGDDFDITADRDHFLEIAFRARLLSAPGARYRYSNVGYSLLGIIIEKITGEGYEQFLNENLFKPAGMKRTGYLLPEYRDDELAVGYRNNEAWGSVIRKPMLPDGPSWHLRANGGIHSTTLDMYRWYLALQGDKVLSPDAKRKLYTAYVPEGPGANSFYGYGWAIFKTPRGTKLIAHNGGNGIFSADFRQYVDEGVMLFHACNVAGIDIDGLSNAIARVVFDQAPTLPPKVISLDATVLAAYRGKYSLADQPAIDVEIEDGGLRLIPHRQAAFDALAPGGSLPDVEARLANARTRELLEGRSRREFPKMNLKRKGRIPSAPVNAEFEKLRKELEERRGSLREVHVLGSRPYRGQRAATVARVHFQVGLEYVELIWQGKSLEGVRLLDGAPSFSFRPLSASEFACLDFQSGDLRRVKFQKDASGRVTMNIQAETGTVTATLSGS